MIRIVPKSEFLYFPREHNHYKKRVQISDRNIQSDLRTKRYWMHHHFKAPAIPYDTYQEILHVILRSDNEDIDYWVIDSASYEMTAVKERSLSRYALEQIMVMEDNSKQLLLIHANDNGVFFGGRGKSISDAQNMEETTISGRLYFWL